MSTFPDSDSLLDAPAAPATAPLAQQIGEAIARAGGWLPFDAFMQLALYAPGLGYYSGGRQPFGLRPGPGGTGGDFVTAPELSPLFGQALAAQVRQALAVTGTDEVWEFGAGSGALAAQLLGALGEAVRRYHIVDVSGSLRAAQQQRLAAWGERVQWHDTLPDALCGVVIGNEVLDAMPVRLLARVGGVWHERGVALAPGTAGAPSFVWADRPTGARPPVEVDEPDEPDEQDEDGWPGGSPSAAAGEREPGDYLTEIHPQGHAFIATLAERLRAGAEQGGKGGAAFFIDYGFPEAEYYHPQRHMGTLVCHRAHQVDDAPLLDVGSKDITAHVNFTGVALAGQDAGLSVLGYTSQAHFLLNCGIATLMEAADLPTRANAMKLLAEHEMGELFKVIGFGTGEPWDALGFAHGDRTHRL